METGGRVGITLRQTLICQALKNEAKTAHAIGEEITAIFRKLPRFKTCTWVGDERDPIESRLILDDESRVKCRAKETEIIPTDCNNCKTYSLRELAPTSTFKNIEVLARHGIITARKDPEGHNKYRLNQGCFNNIIVLKTRDNHLLMTICPNILCKIPTNKKRREINKQCIFYTYLYEKRPIIEVKL